MAVCLLAAAASACQESATAVCGGDFVCPAGTVCAGEDGPCALPEQIEACDGAGDGDACAYPGTPDGSCRDGICVSVACGNGVREGDEVCDDGNAVSGDDCSADCASSEVCGNGVIDPEVGEACDCGDGAVPLPPGCARENSDEPGSTCRPTCTFHGCGDGSISGAEECEGTDLGEQTCESIGFYAGTLGCSGFCRFDTSSCDGTCGDDMVNGPEICDGAAPEGSCFELGFDMGGLGCTQICGVSLARCQQLTWSVMTSNHPGEVYAMWGASENDIFAAGDLGTIAHFNGSVWKQVDTGSEEEWFTSLGGTASNDVFAVGGSGVVWHYDGSEWTAQDSGVIGEDLYDVWVAGLNDVFAVGSGGVIVRYDGAWSPMDSGVVTGLEAVWGSGPDDVFAGGDELLHFDGMDWTPMVPPEGTNPFITGIWGSGPDDVYAVGYGSMLHYNGNPELTWTDVPLSDDVSGITFLKIWGTGTGELFAVGDEIAYFDGSSWFLMEKDSTAFLYSIWGAPSGRVFAGGEGNLVGTILSYGGAAWADGYVPPLSARAVWSNGSNDLYLAGLSGALWHFDGTSWSEPDIGVVTQHLWGLWGSGPDDVYAVGSAGTLLQRDSGGWSPVDLGTGEILYTVWGFGPGDVYVAGSGGLVRHQVDGIWEDLDTGFSTPIYGLWGTSPNDLFAVGSGGTIYHYNGTWTPMDSGVPVYMSLVAVWGAASDDVYAIGGDGTIVHYDGAAWTPMEGNTAESLAAIWGSAADDIYIAGGGGTIIHYDGAYWTPVRSGTTAPLQAVWGAGSEVVFAGDSNALRRLLRSPVTP